MYTNIFFLHFDSVPILRLIGSVLIIVLSGHSFAIDSKPIKVVVKTQPANELECKEDVWLLSHVNEIAHQ
jgi:hypothetical protein